MLNSRQDVNLVSFPANLVCSGSHFSSHLQMTINEMVGSPLHYCRLLTYVYYQQYSDHQPFTRLSGYFLPLLYPRSTRIWTVQIVQYLFTEERALSVTKTQQ